jgi:glycosyltransferase involved in cell wall biosynthesis
MLLSKILTRRKEAHSLGTVAINFRPIDNSYGGMNVFVQQISRWLEDRGYQVIYELRQDIDIIFIVHPWLTHTEPFGFEEVKRFKQSNPKVNVLLRVNECDKRKNTNHMDEWLAQWESISDHTYFISQWLRDYHAKRWFDASRPHSSIYNGADPRIFHPIGSAPYESDKPLRIVTHHWSDNPMKGYADYEKLDAMIASKALTNVEFLVIGRWPADIKWRATTTHGPAHGKTLANLLRSCHVYLTGSQWEPCGMHHVEGIQCGLPVVYHRDGGGIVERAKKYGVEYTDDVCSGIQEMRFKYSEYRHKVLHDPPASGDEMCLRAVDIVQKLRLA